LNLLRAFAGLAVIAGLVSGCGEQSGVAENAMVTVYAAAQLCESARAELARNDGGAGDVRVRVVCLERIRRGGRFDLATIGANARRATEDTKTVAYIGESEPKASRFSRTILESADIPQLANQPGGVAMSKVLEAIEDSGGSGSLRDSVGDALG
jgi:hypothetical protein